MTEQDSVWRRAQAKREGWDLRPALPAERRQINLGWHPERRSGRSLAEEPNGKLQPYRQNRATDRASGRPA